MEEQPQQPQATELTEAMLDIPWREKISRLFIFRPLWMIIVMWVFWVWSIWIGLITFVHFWYMLVLGKKNKMLWGKTVRFFRAQTKWNAYLQMMTDKRPDFIEKQ